MQSSRPRWLRIVTAVVSAGFFMIGLGGLPDDLATWQIWLAKAGTALGGNVGRWGFMIAGLALLGVVNGDVIQGWVRRFKPATPDSPEAVNGSAPKLQNPTWAEQAAEISTWEGFVLRQISKGETIAKQPDLQRRLEAESEWLDVTYAGLLKIDKAWADHFGNPELGSRLEDSLIRLRQLKHWVAI
jgi:hypothetical protein